MQGKNYLSKSPNEWHNENDFIKQPPGHREFDYNVLRRGARERRDIFEQLESIISL